MLEDRVLDTFRFFSFQGVPLTLFELHKFLVSDIQNLNKNVDSSGELVGVLNPGISISIDTLLELLNVMCQRGIVGEKLGFFFLKGEEQKVYTRWRGYAHGIQRERRIKRWANGLRHAPFTIAAGITGSQAFGLEKPGSDIDLFIITEKKWMWTARTLVTLYFQILGIRRHGARVTNRMCLNHYVAGVKTFTVGRNLYTALEYGKIRPIFGSMFFKQLQQKNTSWITVFFPNWKPVHGNAELFSPVRLALEWCIQHCGGNFLELSFKQFQTTRIKTSIKFIVVEEDELSFHPNSKQENLLKSFFNQ